MHPLGSWKRFVHHGKKTTTKKDPRILFQTWMGQHPSHRSPAAGLLSCQLFTDCCSKKRGHYWAVKMALSQPFLGTLLKWNKSTFSQFKHFIHFLYYIFFDKFTFTYCPNLFGIGVLFCFLYCRDKKEQTATVSYFLQASNILSMQITSSFTMMQWKASMVISTTTAKTNCTWF